MLDIEKFVAANNSKHFRKIVVEKGRIVFRCDSIIFNGRVVRSLLQFAGYICNAKHLSGFPIQFFFTKSIKFEDKLMYILFECICYYLIRQGHRVNIKIIPVTQITTHGFSSSPLLLLSTGKLEHIEKFEKKFAYEIYGRHFRKILSNDIQTNELSILMDEIAIFQKPFEVKEGDREKIAEVLTELVGNSIEHTSGSCLIDFDITDEYLKRGVDGKKYLGINIVILNFSEELLGTSLKKKLNLANSLSVRYEQVLKALDRHTPFFNERYLPEDFYNIATFQHKISGRMDNDLTGGTGLTKLIKSLEEEADAYLCYVNSGRRQLQFKHEYMGFDENGWIGFNDTNDFLTAPPSEELICNIPYMLPGTAYNLTFVMEVEKSV